MGMGPMTGRGMGPCGGGYKRGSSRGFGGWFMPRRRQRQWTAEEEKRALEEEEKDLKEELKAIQEEKKDLGKGKNQPPKNQ